MRTLAAAILLLMPSVAFAYELNLTDDGYPIRWNRDRVEFHLDDSFIDSLPEGHAERAATMAFGAWRGLPGVPDLVLTEGASNGIYVHDEWPYHEASIAATKVRFNPKTGRITDVDILINADDEFNLYPGPNAFDIAGLLTHEAGHVLGLGNSNNPDATMWPHVTAGDTSQRTLAKDDENGIVLIYAFPRRDASGCAVGAGGSGWAWIAVLILLWKGRRR